MRDPIRSSLALTIALAIAAFIFLAGITWGLPSKAVDPFLFGAEPVWPGEKIAALAPSDANTAGADVDSNPITDRSAPVVLNETDQQRAEIIRRYRLFSYQPDEMITLRSLSRIKQFHGDPRLYQYGGLWIYPVGVMLKAASIVGLVDLKADQAYHLDNPEAFGRFYVVARFYTVLWGLVAVWAVYTILLRLTRETALALAGAVCFAAMPVVVNMAHEAKPHLPSLALILLSVIAAANHVESKLAKWAILAGVLCGAAFGMVLSGLLAFAILPIMALLRGGTIQERLLGLIQATIAGVLTYLLTNPFVPINAIFNHAALQSNLTNSTNMYRIGLGGGWNAISLIVAGASPIVAIGGMVGVVVLLFTYVNQSRDEFPESHTAWLLAAPAAAVLVQFVLLAENKPPEYARFALVPNTLLLIAAIAATARIRAHYPRLILALAMIVMTGMCGLPYLDAFLHDSSGPSSRLLMAKRITGLAPASIQIAAEPAPYSLPPIDLFRTRLILMPQQQANIADAAVLIDPTQSRAPISWADVHFRIISTRRQSATTLSSAP